MEQWRVAKKNKGFWLSFHFSRKKNQYASQVSIFMST